MSFSLYQYLPILLMFIVAAGFAGVNVFISQYIGQRKHTKTKLMPYECGKDPVGSARERFSVKFYMIAMIFILFDIEVIFLIPWAVVFKSFVAQNQTMLIYVEMMLFVVLLLAGYIYVLKKGAFDWSDRARVEAEAEARLLHDVEKQRARITRTAA